MPVQNQHVVAARRARLQAWIDTHYKGSQASFIAATGINQGELSGLLKNKSFGEKRAASLEIQARMPAGYLVNPLSDKSESSQAPAAWAAYQAAPAATRAAVDLLLLPKKQRAAVLASSAPALAGGVDLVEQYAQAALSSRKTA